MADGTPETTGPDDDSFQAEDARKQWAELLNRVQWQGRHVTIRRSSRVAGVLVPQDWYERASEALAEAEAGNPTQAMPKKRAK